MGLDVYFHHTTVAFEGDKTNPDDFNNFREKITMQEREEFKKKIEQLLAPLRTAWEQLQTNTNTYWRNVYNDKYFSLVEKLRPLIAKIYDWKIHPFVNEILDLPELEKKLESELDTYYTDEDAYFRKVNFLFAYYQNKGKMVDEYYAFTDASDIDDIIDRCERVLKDHDLANELLPTQGGFFFGGTEYDDWYFHDVKDCLEQMKKYRKLLKDGVTGYVIFSW